MTRTQPSPRHGGPEVFGAGGGCAEVLRGIDWQNHPLGPVSGWSEPLRTAVAACLSSPEPVEFYWGPRRVCFYNDAFALTLNGRHPDVLGRATANPMGDASESVAGWVEPNRELLSHLAAPVYVCDAQGRVTMYNEAAAELWGRRPEIGKDLWCGWWRMFRPTGEVLPHDQCPMAVALREGRPVRGEEIVVERPDGTRRFVLPHPEPILDGSGRVIGAVNVLFDVTAQREAELAARDGDRALRRSEAIARSILENTPDSVKLLDLDGRMLWINEPGRRLMEIDEAASPPRAHWRDIWRPEMAPVIDAAIEEAKRGRVAKFDGYRPTAAGTPKWWDVAIVAIPGPAGEPEQLLSVARDVTDRKRIQDELRESETRLSLALEAGEMGAWGWDAASGRVAWSATLERIYGIPAGSFGGTFEDFRRDIHPEDVDRVLDAIGRTFSERGDYHVQYRMIRPDGAVRWLEARGRVVVGDDGAPAGMTGVCMDVTERTLAEQELADHRAHLEELVDARTRQLEESHQRLRLSERMALLGTLSAGLGHDMGNLLVPVRVRVENLERAGLPEHLREDVASIKSSAGYLQRLATGLRLVAVDPAGRTDETVEFNEWWAEAGMIYKHLLPRNVSLEPSFPPPPCIAAISKPALTQAVFNLIQNAGDAMSGRGAGRVTVTAEATDEEVVLRISDNGPGMDEETRRRCMEPFFTTKPRAISTGLGLALVFGLIREAGGEIEIESAPGAGATFTITLPGGLECARRHAGGSGRTAVVSVRDPRMRAFVVAELKALSYDVRPAEGAGPAANTDVVIVDELDQARGFPAADVVLLGGAGEPGRQGRVLTLGSRPTPQAMRQALKRLSREGRK